MIKCVLLLSGISIFLCGCKHDTGLITPLPNKDIVLNDVSYGDDSLQKMDVYLPANRATQTKIIIYLHGGSWCMGDKSEAKETAIYFQQKGYACISMNYRLTRTPANYINPVQMQDIAKAIDFISQKYLQWIITGNRICLFGGSAGANLSLLYAYKYNDDKKVKAVLSVCAPVDLIDSNMRNTPFKDMRESFVGSKIGENQQAWIDASPTYFASETSVPTLFFQGTQDAIVPYRQTVSLYNKLVNYGVNTKLILFPGADHNLQGVDIGKMLSEMEEFIDTAFP